MSTFAFARFVVAVPALFPSQRSAQAYDMKGVGVSKVAAVIDRKSP